MTCFADSARYEIATVTENVRLARDTMRVRIAAPEMARQAVPGQFFMIRIATGNDPLIGRAFALYELDPEDRAWFDLVYLVKGRLTTRLAELRPGDPLAVWGPLGNGFDPIACDHLIMVAGGIGQTPFLALGKEALGRQAYGTPPRPSGYASDVTFCYGVRSADYLSDVDRFQQLGCEVLVATEDGSAGPAQRVTDVLEQVLARQTGRRSRIACCGPEPMMEAVAAMARRYQVPCQVSLETPMACGIGICFTCVARIGTPHDWDYKRTCVEGPVFDAHHVQW
ncbi:MAG: dihydroorotate dehydrogenase electron transfer subunit [Planctomycetota bacterium]|nr:MAG: dihydroorotate dehydrogenase electron transfer subunit [Planctomycetota bacterium]